MLNVIPGSKLMEDERNKQQKKNENEDSNSQSTIAINLAGYIRTRWFNALTAKRITEIQMLINKRQRKGDYEPEKLASIRKMGSAESFILLTDTKCRAALAWVKDILFQPGQRPFSLEPTPEPELPEELEQQVIGHVMSAYTRQIMETTAAQGNPIDPGSAMMMLQNNMPDVKEQIRKEFFRKSKERAQETEKHIDKQLIDGGWYKALEDCLEDLVELKACILKGPILRHDKVRKKQYNRETGKASVTVHEEIRPQFERRSPFDIYPAPESCGVNDSYLFDKIQLTRKGLYDLIGLPGFNEKEIREVLKEFGSGNLREWTGIESELLDAQGKDPTTLYQTEKIDCLEFWDFVPGQLLMDWGMEEKDIQDKDDSYPICAWLIGNHVIKAMLNYDPFGNKPFSVGSFDMVADNFWGKGIPELIQDIQGICNAVVRAIVNNVGLASGPQIEMNRSKFPVGLPLAIWPWKVWEYSDTGLSPTPALRIHHIPLNADKLILIYNHFSKLADEESGVPAYSHGDPNVGGAGNTASGLSMLMTQSARGIKNVMRTIDSKLIADTIERLYYLNMEMEDNDDYVFDMHVMARGSSSLIAKEQQAVRLNEFLTQTNNPVDMQIIGLEGRKNLLEQTAKAHEIDTANIIPEVLKIENMMTSPTPGIGGQTPQGGNQPAPANIDAAGNMSQGEDNRLIDQSDVPQMRAKK